MRCEWCGHFVRAGTEPTPGVNWFGEPRSQIVCPDCRPHWIALAARNAEHQEAVR